MADKNIFISYGHGNYDALVKRLADDLRMVGFSVFLDVDYLHKGDWERVIDEHILASRYFLFMVSARSVSHDGYCLNELCRAGEVRSEIIPVLLDGSTIPLSINKHQRLSMQTAIDPEGKIIDGEYRRILTKLIEVLSGKIKLGFSDADMRLRSGLKPISSKELTYSYYSGFSGRKDVFQAVERFMANEDRNIFWLNAGPGTGKTAISSMLTWLYPEQVGAVHFCKFNNSDRVNPKVIITSIAYQLAETIPEYKDKLLGLMELDTLFEKNATRIFEYLILEPMSSLDRREPVMVVVDALDECSRMGSNEICSILQRTREALPIWLKFVLTSRNEPEVSRILKPIAQMCVLSEEQTEEDLREYYSRQFPEATEYQIELLINKSEGSFLYAREIVKQIRSDHLSLTDINVFPIGIYGFFNDCFSRIFGEGDGLVSFEEVKPLLEFLCIEQEPTEIDFLEEFLEWDEYRIKKLLAAICSLFPIKNGYIEPLHKSIIDWLTSDDIDQVYYISRKNGYKRLLAYVEKVYAGNKWRNNKYVLKYFGTVLIELGQFVRLSEILTDYDLQQNIIDYFEFDSGLDNYLGQIDRLHKADAALCTDHLSSDTFIRIFSQHRRLLYNSGMFFKLKDLGLSIALRRDNRDWGLEGEVGKVFYYYIVEDFAKAIKRAETLLQQEGQEHMTSAILSEIYNVKGLSERKIVEFDRALDSFERSIEYAELALDEVENPYSDAEFELSLANLIKGKIFLSTLRFEDSNKSCRKAVKILSRKIEEMPDGDKRTSNKLFLAEDFRVSAYGYIWQQEYEAAEDCLDKAEEIYLENRNTVDRYYIRFQYTSQFLRIMEKQSQGVRDELKVLLKDASGKYDKGQINFLLGLDALRNHPGDREICEEGLKCAMAGADIYDDIDAYLEKAECSMVAKHLARILGKKVMLDTEDNQYIDKWIEYLESVLTIGETV